MKRDFALRRAGGKRIMNPQFLNEPIEPGIAGEQRRQETTRSTEPREPTQRYETCLSRRADETRQHILEEYRPARDQAAFSYIDADVPEAIRQDRVLVPGWIDRQRELHLEPPRIEIVR